MRSGRKEELERERGGGGGGGGGRTTNATLARSKEEGRGGGRTTTEGRRKGLCVLLGQPVCLNFSSRTLQGEIFLPPSIPPPIRIRVSVRVLGGRNLEEKAGRKEEGGAFKGRRPTTREEGGGRGKTDTETVREFPPPLWSEKEALQKGGRKEIETLIRGSIRRRKGKKKERERKRHQEGSSSEFLLPPRASEVSERRSFAEAERDVKRANLTRLVVRRIDLSAINCLKGHDTRSNLAEVPY